MQKSIKRFERSNGPDIALDIKTTFTFKNKIRRIILKTNTTNGRVDLLQSHYSSRGRLPSQAARNQMAAGKFEQNIARKLAVPAILG